MNLRRAPLIAASGFALMLGACTSSQEKADGYEAQFDKLIAVQAYPAALVSIQKAISYDDTTARRYMKMAELQMMMGRPAAAANSFQSALDLEPGNVEALQNLAILTVRGGQFDVAQRHIDTLFALSPNDPAGLLASGAIALNQHRFADALGFADRTITAMPDRGDGYVLKARALDGLGRNREAVDLLEKRSAAAPDAKDVLLQLMSFYRRDGNLRGIRATAIRLMPLFPSDPRYALESARAYGAEGKQDKVREITDDLLQRYQNNADVLVAIGNFWRETLPAAEARARVSKLAEDSRPRIRSVLADQLIDMGDPKDALRLLASLAPPQVTSANIDSQTHYARALLAAGQTAQAQAKVNAVLAFDHSNPTGLLLSARLKLLAKDYRGAFTDAQLVANDDDSNEEAALLVAQIYAAQGNQLLAAGAFGNAGQRFPDSTDILKAETDWLMSQNRGAEAAERATSFFLTHKRNGPAAKIYHDVCSKTRAPACGKQTLSVAGMLAL